MGIVLAFILVPPSVFSTIPKSRQKGKNSNLANCYVTLMHSIQERPGNHNKYLIVLDQNIYYSVRRLIGSLRANIKVISITE